MGRTVEMLFKCYIWGVDILIFVILGGVVEFDFSRLLRTVDELVVEKVIDDSVIAQRGYSTYIPKNYESFDFVDGNLFNNYIKEADLIITHGGVASLISALKLKKKIIAFPRLEKYKEHLDNHQIEITSILSDKGYIMYATDKKMLKKCILNYRKFEPIEFKTNNFLMEKLIVNFIEDKC